MLGRFALGVFVGLVLSGLLIGTAEAMKDHPGVAVVLLVLFTIAQSIQVFRHAEELRKAQEPEK